MENLYTFSKHSWHVQFFKWMWNINPVDKYKTMCPYFWQFIGSIFLLPFIISWKLIMLIADPIIQWLDEVAERSAEIETSNLLFKYHTSQTLEEKYILWKSKCYKKYIDGLLNMGEISYADIDKFRQDAWAYKSLLEAKTDYNKAKQQANIDKIKYGIIGKIFLWLLFVVVMFFAGVFINWFLHLITFIAFIKAILIILGAGIGTIIVFGIIALIMWFNDNYNCNGQLTKFNPFIYVIMIFKGIWKLFKIIIDMIGNLYKESCPIITWKE